MNDRQFHFNQLGQEWSRLNRPLIRKPGGDLQGKNLRGEYFVWADFSNMDLRETDFVAANQDYADFTGADLTGAKLDNVTLCEAKITDEQLCSVTSLHRAMMPDGSPYDGRYNLSGDLLSAEGQLNANNKPSSPELIADYYYSIPVDDYLAGQEWANENLARVCGDSDG